MKNFTHLKRTFALLTLLFITIISNAQTAIYTNPANNGLPANTFTVPAGVTQITVSVWAGGGRGGARTSGTVYSGGGGGGAYAQKLVTVIPGNTYTVNVGAGSTTTAAGGDSWFDNTSNVLAKGGESVANNSSTGALGGAASPSSIGDVTYAGGNGANGSSGSSYGGGGGSVAGTTSNGNTATNATGPNAPAPAIAPAGKGGNGRSGSSGNGSSGTFPGGGGGGLVRTSGSPTPGNGANGQVIITYISVSPEINIQGNATSIADGDTTPTNADFTDFGSTNVGTGITRTYTIQNTGIAPLTIGAITFSGTNPGDFSATSPSSPIAAGGSTTFVVTFNPSASGVRNATISIVNDDTDENPYNFSLQGTGTEQEINVQGNAVSIVDGDITPTNADFTVFPTTSVGVGVTRTYTIQNIGTLPLNITGLITFSGFQAGDFSATAPSSPIAAGSSSTFVVTFIPSAAGTRNAIINIPNNDGDENPYNYSIQGVGTEQEINIQGNASSILDGDTSPATADFTDFGTSAVGLGINNTFTIQNTGTTTLTIGAITFSGTNPGDFTILTAPSATVAAGGSTTFVVTFTAGASGLRTATINIVNNDSNENPYNFALQGTGSTLTAGPGGVLSSLQLWFRSDLLNGTTGVADGSAVNTWNTQGRGSDAIRPGSVGAPVYRNNPTYNINFNSVVDFTNNPATSPQNYTDLDASRQYLKGPTGFYSHDIFAVIIPDINVTSATASLDIFCGDRVPATNQTDGTGIGYGRYTLRFTDEVVSYCLGTTSGGNNYGVAHVDSSATVTYNTAGIINASNNAAVNGMNLTFNSNNIVTNTNDPSDFSNVSNSQFWMGRSEGWDGSWDGRIGEIITLDSRASDADRSKIMSYLAIKYGITLGVNGTSMNYTNSDGNIIWDATANSGYNYDIAGIGRNNISKLNQKQSKSINPTEVMTIGLTDILATNTANTSTFATDKSFLVWGSNGGTMVDSGVNLNIDLGPTTITTITEVVNRKWKVVETGGDVATTRVAVPTAAFVSGLPALGATDAYVMVVSTNAAFTTGLETVFMSTTAGNQTCLYDFDGTKFITFGVAHQAVNPLHITLDGADDFVKIDNTNELTNNFTVMTWIRPNGANALGTERTILSKKATATTGYQLVLQNDNRVRMEWYGVAPILRSLVSNTAIPDAKWHNIAVTYNNITKDLVMYIDGVKDTNANIAQAPATSTSFFSIGAQYIDKNTINNLFKGDIDELRMWSRDLSPTEIRFIMNQEILQNGTGTRGTIVPNTISKNDIGSLLWSNLFAYYSMNSYIGTHLDDDSFNVNRGSLVIPDKISISLQTAPMPYQSTADGMWSNTATWLNGSIQDLPYSLSIIDGTTPIDWNIIRTNHEIESNGNKVTLGLFVNANTLSATNDSKIEVSHYLKLDGKIDLTGKSQLVQTLNSDLDVTSAGSIERDQQGQKIIHNYNYWSSPVSSINNTTINHGYTVAGVMKDGTSETPDNITWTAGLNGSPTTPITLSSYWIFKFQNLTASYANWQSVGQNGALLAGQGYTLKGSGAPGLNQNYTFVGKPNNGLITGVISANNLNLSGNPYSSALDANAFINANNTTTTGALYFWEHYSTNNSHNLAAYQGGYAMRTLVGGTPPVAPPYISGLGSSSKVPNRYVPVGQGFFILGSSTGGAITFNNDQRAFVKENNVSAFTMFKANNISSSNTDHFTNNSDDDYTVDNFKKIRLGFDDRNGYHRQLLLGFMNENATNGIDVGYDGVLLDNQPSDMYFLNGGAGLNISGEDYFDENEIFPLAVKTDALGTVSFNIDGMENFDDNQVAYIYDNVTDIYHNLVDEHFSIELPQGTITDRFSLRFIAPGTLSTNDHNLESAIQIAYTSSNDILNIKNSLVDASVEKVELYNMLGQAITSWNVEEANQQNIQLPVKNISTGTYIVKIKTNKGNTSRKIMFN